MHGLVTFWLGVLKKPFCQWNTLIACDHAT
jgi:hypothetical protein